MIMMFCMGKEPPIQQHLHSATVRQQMRWLAVRQLSAVKVAPDDRRAE